MIVILTIVFVSSLFLSMLSTRIVRSWAIDRDWVHHPISDRNIHTRPIPRLGGIALFVSFWLVILLGIGLRGLIGFSLALAPLQELALKFAAPATIIFLLGLYDDLRPLNAKWKFGIQGVAAIWLFVNGFGVSHLGLVFGTQALSWYVSLPLTVFWVLLITNAFNLIDGLDGLAAGAALFTTILLFLVSWHSNQLLFSFILLALAGSIAGFLRYNFHPASIFLGDSGSLLIGFLLSALALSSSQKSPTMVAVVIPVIALGLPILDVIIAVGRRFIGAKPLFDADAEHIHHKLLHQGLTHCSAVLVLYAFTGGLALLSLVLLQAGGRALGLTLTILGLAVVFGVRQLEYVEFSELRRCAGRLFHQRQIVAGNLAIWRGAQRLQECRNISELGSILAHALGPVGFDGCGLCLPKGSFHSLELNHWIQSTSGEFQYFWKTGQDGHAPGWKLTIDLVTSDGRICGSFSVFRFDKEIWRFADLNLLTASGLCAALANVVDHQAFQMETRLTAPKVVVPKVPMYQNGSHTTSLFKKEEANVRKLPFRLS